MSDTNVARGLVQTWVSVIDGDGGTRLEAHWVDAAAAHAAAHAPVQTAVQGAHTPPPHAA